MAFRRIAAWLLGAGTLLAATAGAPRVARADHTYELKRNLPVDVAVTVAAAGLVFATEYVKDDLAPRRCVWCDSDASGRDTLNPVDRGMRDLVRWKNGRPARQLSDTLAFVIAPATSVGTLLGASVDAGVERGFPIDMLVMLEAVSLSQLLNQTLKLSLGRERPFVHALPDEEKAKQPQRSDNNLSFYSGHTSITFAIAAASGTIASLRDYRSSAAVWGSLVPMAALTGYFRMAGDRHYFTDVLTGAVLGSAVGVLVPLAFHGRSGKMADTLPEAVSGGAVTPASLPPMITFSGGF